jgi:hypothetical protein
MADDDQAARGDSGWRVGIRPACVSLLAERGSERAAERPARLARAVPADLQRARDRPAAAARQRPQRQAHGVSRRLPADAGDGEGRAAAALTVHRDLPCVPEISANKYALNIRFIGVTGMDRGAVYDHDVEFELVFCNL